MFNLCTEEMLLKIEQFTCGYGLSYATAVRPTGTGTVTVCGVWLRYEGQR